MQDARGSQLHFPFVLLTKYYEGDQKEGDEMGGERNRNSEIKIVRLYKIICEIILKWLGVGTSSGLL